MFLDVVDKARVGGHKRLGLVEGSCPSVAALGRRMGVCFLDHELLKRVSDEAEEKRGPRAFGDSTTIEEAGSSHG